MKRPETDKPICLDLYCAAGGCSVGYERAGFYVIGVDIKEQPNYPFTFIQADALEFDIPDWVDFVHASPECQRFSVTRTIGTVNLDNYGDDIEPIREKLRASGKPYVIENVPGAPLDNPITLHGDMFGLQVIRKRLFESNVMLWVPPMRVKPGSFTNTSSGYSSFKNGANKITVAGNNFNRHDGAKAMGIDWMSTHKELALSIPPDYTEFIGRQIMDYINLESRRVAA